MKGICFKEELFNAIIEGRKTQTRRIVKPQPPKETTWIDNVSKEGEFYWHTKESGRNYFDKNCFVPRYRVGDTVYLKEPYRDTGAPEGHFAKIDYLYDKTGLARELAGGYKWENKLFMPERYARYFIKITAVRCEHLQEISDEDCESEGIVLTWNISRTFVIGCSNKMDGVNYNNRKEAYAALIDKINGKGTWESNPYVFVYSFELVKKHP